MTDTNKLKAQIHIAKQQLGMDDETYRAVLKSATGKTSSAQMGVVDLHKALQAFKDKGFKSRPPRKKTDQKKPAGPYGLLQKIKDQWRGMGEQKILRDSSDAALRSYVSRQTNGRFEAPEFLDNRNMIMVLESLKQWQLRELRERKWEDV